MAIKEGYIVYGHLGNDRNFRDGVRITKFGVRDLSEALRYVIDGYYNSAEIKYGSYEVSEYSKREVGTPKLIGTVRKNRRNGIISYSLTMNGYRYPVDRDGSMGKPKKIQTKKKGTPFGL